MRVERGPLDLELREAELLLDRRRDPRAQFDAVPAHRAAAIPERERRGAATEAEMDRRVGFDPVERARRLGQRDDGSERCTHCDAYSGQADVNTPRHRSPRIE